MDLIDKIQQILDLLSASIRSLRKTSEQYAEAERDYKILLRQQALKLRDEGMAIGMITLTIYGIPEVAEARLKRDISEANYKANQEAINSYKLQLRLLDNQVNREWGNTGGQL